MRTIIRPCGLIKVSLPVTIVKPEDAEVEIKAAIRSRQRDWRKELGLGVML